MKKQTTYKTLAGAYDAMIKREAVAYTLNSREMALLVDALKERKFTKTATTVALANIYACNGEVEYASYTQDLCVLKQTDKGFEWECVGFVESVNDKDTVYFQSASKPDEKVAPRKGKGDKKPTPAKGKVVTYLTKAEKKSIRSECMRLAKGDRAKYDELCKARGVDNHR